MAISRGETEAGSGTTYKTQAEKWAENPENTPVVPGKYSALHHAAKAKDSETAARASEDAARASEQAAATSENNAKDSEDAAALSESNAATSEANAAASESAAATSEANAAASESNAADSEASALASLEDFLDHYYGSYSSEPTTDPNGNPVNAGDLYWDTTIGELRVYDGSTWISAAYNSSNVNITGGTVLSLGVTGDNLPLLTDFDEQDLVSGFYRWDSSTANAPSSIGGGAIKFFRSNNTAAWLAMRPAGNAGDNDPRMYVKSTSGTDNDWGDWAPLPAVIGTFSSGNLMKVDGDGNLQDAGVEVGQSSFGPVLLVDGRPVSSRVLVERIDFSGTASAIDIDLSEFDLYEIYVHALSATTLTKSPIPAYRAILLEGSTELSGSYIRAQLRVSDLDTDYAQVFLGDSLPDIYLAESVAGPGAFDILDKSQALHGKLIVAPRSGTARAVFGGNRPSDLNFRIGYFRREFAGNVDGIRIFSNEVDIGVAKIDVYGVIE